MIKAPKKLIECALPLDEINAAAAREKSIRHGHPSTLHLWWARRPLAAARAVLFAQLVNDPGGERGWGNYPGQTKKDAQRERERLFVILRELVKWENTNNEELLEKAREEIRKSWRDTCQMNKGKPGFDPDKLPAFHDPFAGGGAIPLEAQRLGLEAYASDLNPVAVLINKAMIEIPPKFAGKAPVGPMPEGEQGDARGKDDWTGAKGLAEDVRRYGHWMRKEAEKRIGHLYPKVKITREMVEKRPDLQPYLGRELTVIAWIWARTVKSPNPAFSHVDVPLASTFMLSTKKGKEACVVPVIEGDSYRFEVKVGKPEDAEEVNKGTKMGRGANFKCLISGSPITSKYIKSEGQKGRMDARLMAIVLKGDRGRVYLSSDSKHEQIAHKAKLNWKPQNKLIGKCADQLPLYGMRTFADLFTSRQLVALTTFSDLVQEAREKVIADAKRAGWLDDGIGLDDGGSGATAYGDAVAVYLAISNNKSSDRNSSICGWDSSRDSIRNTFGRQAIPMVWDYAESNIIGNSSGSFINAIMQTVMSVTRLNSLVQCKSLQLNIASQNLTYNKVVCTDPPYYDNIGYADLSDFFYIWLRRSLKHSFSSLFSTVAVPKAEELIATPYRHGNKQKAEAFFLDGMTKAVKNMADQAHQAFPVTIYYAFKQSESNNGSGTSSIGWEKFLDAVILANFSITGTWPMRTELGNRMISSGTNALASSIVLVCRKRDPNAPAIPRRQFLRELKEEMPEALETMIGGKEGATAIAPVDLAQAAIGPGMAIYSRYSGILEADGSKMSVRDALIQINKVVDEFFNEAEGDMDSDTRFCIDWFMQYGFKAGLYGEADVLARAKGTTVDGLVSAGVVEARGGNVRLLRFDEYAGDWDPQKDKRTPTWQALHQLILALRTGGETEAGRLLSRMTERTEPVRQLAYRLFTLCERKGWAEEARAYNELIASWYGTVEASAEDKKGPREKRLQMDELLNQ